MWRKETERYVCVPEMILFAWLFRETLDLVEVATTPTQRHFGSKARTSGHVHDPDSQKVMLCLVV
jgi:hypothetical protein